jgi:hypothetical protein
MAKVDLSRFLALAYLGRDFATSPKKYEASRSHAFSYHSNQHCSWDIRLPPSLLEANLNVLDDLT